MFRDTDPNPTASAPIGPYSPGRWAGPFLFLSGRLGLDPASGELIAHGLREQAAQAMRNLEAGLHQEGLSLAQVVKTTVFLTNMAYFADFNQVYAGFFAGCAALPARSCVQVAALPRGGCVEIEAVAYRQD
jgi:2-iminobutanoate/2-iminopropanoate deaminase